MIKLGFHGGAGTVTGSKHLLSVDGESVLVDCGMFQGLKELRERNWRPPVFDPRTIKHVVLTHAHLDHCGWLPRLYRSGFRGEIVCTGGTRDLAEIILTDSAHLQVEEAEYRNKKGATSHKPALPLYGPEDVPPVMKLFREIDYGKRVELSPRISVRMLDAGHILGSAVVELKLRDGSREVTVVASGDVGRYDMPLNPDPEPLPECDALLLESTYGDRAHGPERPEDQLLGVAREAFANKGILIVPAFAVGRSQQIIFILNELFASGKLPKVPVYLDSPMGIDATKLYCKYAGTYRVDPEVLKNGVCTLFDGAVRMVRTVEQSKALLKLQGPAVLIASSGMLTGGRILHHLKNLLPDPKNVVAMVGYQAAGTRGRYLIEGAKTFRVFGEEVPVNAKVADLKGFSGHADADELLRWAGKVKPKQCWLVHGEPKAAEALAARFKQEKSWDVSVAQLDQEVEL